MGAAGFGRITVVAIIAKVRPARTTAWGRARSAILDGIVHATTGLLHLAFALVLCLVAPGRRGLRYVGLFLAGQVIAVAAAQLSGANLPAPTSALALALATAFFGAAAARGRAGAGFGLVPFVAGLFHGPATAGSTSSMGAQLGALLGMDAVLLVGVGLATLCIRSPRSARLTRAGGAAVLGALSLALVLLWVAQEPAAARLDAHLAEPRVGAPAPLPGADRAGAGADVRVATAAPAPPLPSVPLQTFVVIEPYEVRHEILARLGDLAPWIAELADQVEVPVSAQEALRARIARLFVEHEAMTIDGVTLQPAPERVDFVTIGPKGTLPRAAPVPEVVGEAYVGVVFSFPTGPIAEELSLAWSLFGPVTDAVPVAVTDPEQTRTLGLSPSEPRLTWKNELAFDPVPRVDMVRVEPITLCVPVAATPLFGLAFLLLLRSRKRGARAWLFAGARLSVAAGLLLSPLVELALPMPFASPPTPTPESAQRIASALLTNVYQAFVFKEEGAIYDRLAVSVAGDKLNDVYLEHRRALEIAERGGARARVEAVEVEAVRDIEPAGSPGGGFSAEYTWTVAGSVSHFGHRHYRQNRYVARIVVEPLEGAWRIVSIEVLDEHRVL